jgi:hypothetical protein
MSDSSFLSQLEQRTQQVKVTLANLEAEKTRIENLIGQLQPLVPQYDALISAERAIADAHIELHAVDAPESHEPEQSYGWGESAPEAERQPEHSWNG